MRCRDLPAICKRIRPPDGGRWGQMYDFASNLQERARVRHDRNVEAVGTFISADTSKKAGLRPQESKLASRPASIGLPRDQPNPGRRAAPGQHVSHPYGHKRPGRELNWTENTTT